MNRTKTLGWLVGAAALLFAGCSSEDGVIAEETKIEETTAQTAATIHVTVGAGISGGEATTRSTVDYTGGTRTLQFTTGDRLYVWGHDGDAQYEPSGAIYYDYIVAGYLDLDTESFDASDPTNATFTGELTVYRWINEEGTGEGAEYIPEIDGYYDPVSSSGIFSTADPLGEFSFVTATLIHEGTASQDISIDECQNISLSTKDCAATVEALMTSGLRVSGIYYENSKSFTLQKEGAQPIVNCTIAGLEGSTVGTVSLGQKAFEGKVYNVSRRFVDLGDASIYSDEGVGFIAQNGDILSGTMPTDQFRVIRIADGAKVTLHNATIENSNYHGIKCDGSATINLEGANIVSGGWGGINCDGTLTIQGSGSLAATGSNGYAGIGDGAYSHVVIKGGTIVARGSAGSNYSGAGIGGGGGGTFGNIRIEGGDVTATGGDNAAGIGSGYRLGNSFTCGTITITGGTVRAAGGANAAGIGCGKGNDYSHQNVCGDITISGGTVEATAGTGDCSAIGYANYYCRCNNVTIEGGEVTANSTSEATIGAYTVSITSGITSVTMTNSAATDYNVSTFINGNTITIDDVTTQISISASGYYGNVHSDYDLSTKTWTLYKE